MKSLLSSDKDIDVPMIKQRMALLKQSINKFSSADSLHQLCKEIVLSTTKVLGFDRCGCFLYDAQNNQKLGTWGIDPNGDLVDEAGTTAPVYPHETRKSVNNQGVVVFYNKMLHHQDEAIGRGTLLQCTVYDGEELLGWLFIDNYLSKQDFTTNDIEFLELFGSVVGQLIVRRKHEEALVKKNVDLNSALVQLGRMQKEVIDQKKISALGNLVTGVAHELNTPIGVSVTGVSHITSLVDDLIRATNPCTLTKSQIEAYLNELKDTAVLCERNLKRSSDLIQKFKRLKNVDNDPVPTSVNLQSMIQERFEVARQKYAHKEVELFLDKNNLEPCYDLPELSLSMVVSELFDNAFQHAFIDVLTPAIEVKLSLEQLKDQQFIAISIADNGIGMAEQDLEKLFEPFYTTNRQKGTGLGASIMYQTVKYQLQGEIEVCRREGTGLEFKVLLPTSGVA